MSIKSPNVLKMGVCRDFWAHWWLLLFAAFGENGVVGLVDVFDPGLVVIHSHGG